MPTEGVGTCLVPKDNGVPCGTQIEQGEAIRSLTLPFGGAIIGHKACVDGYEARKNHPQEDDMVKRVDQSGPGGSVDMNTAVDAIQGSIPLDKRPADPLPDLSQVKMPDGVRPVSEVPFIEPIDNWAQGVENRPVIPPPPAEVLHQAAEPDQAPDESPEGGWRLEDFPQITTTMIPYTAHVAAHADPLLTLTEEGWLFLDTGNIRVAFPNQAEWDKLATMVNWMFTNWRLRHPTPTQGEDNHDAGHPD